MSSVLEVYAAGLRTAGWAPLRARLGEGPAVRLPLERWLGPTDAADEEVLSRAHDPTIDLGCGPGRHLAALARRGIFALGVDISPAAVVLARQHGAQAIRASVFDALPATGRWRTALLLDGNIGIGGTPVRLLRRVAELLSIDGEVLIELDDRATATAALDARIEAAGLASDWFRWAQVSIVAIDAVGAAAGCTVAERWRSSGRWFARLTRETTALRAIGA